MLIVNVFDVSTARAQTTGPQTSGMKCMRIGSNEHIVVNKQ